MADFDVFISYNRAEQPAVLKLAALLRDRGLKPWLDVWNLVPGEPWSPAVERALQSSATCAVIVGPSGLGGVHEHEMWTAIERSLSCTPDHGFRVIPVLLPNSTRGDRALLPSFLSRHTWVEFLKSLDASAALDAFANAIKGEPPSPAVSLPRGECPFRGLAHFEVADAPLFFGREALTDWLLSRLSGTAKNVPVRFDYFKSAVCAFHRSFEGLRRVRQCNDFYSSEQLRTTALQWITLCSMGVRCHSDPNRSVLAACRQKFTVGTERDRFDPVWVWQLRNLLPCLQVPHPQNLVGPLGLWTFGLFGPFGVRSGCRS